MAKPDHDADLEAEARTQAAVAEAYYRWEEEGDDFEGAEGDGAGLDSGGFPRLAHASDAELGDLWRRVNAAAGGARGDV